MRGRGWVASRGARAKREGSRPTTTLSSARSREGRASDWGNPGLAREPGWWVEGVGAGGEGVGRRGARGGKKGGRNESDDQRAGAVFFLGGPPLLSMTQSPAPARAHARCLPPPPPLHRSSPNDSDRSTSQRSGEPTLQTKNSTKKLDLSLALSRQPAPRRRHQASLNDHRAGPTGNPGNEGCT